MSKTNKNASAEGVFQTLAWIRKNGFRPVIVHPNSKAAISREYVALDYEPPSDDRWKTHNYGVGVVCGPKHKGPIDIDLDCDEALFLAPKFFPSTSAIFGRASKRQSHFLYRVSDDECLKQAYSDPVTGKTIIEVRGDGGHQTVFPGSIHENTGEPIEWASIAFPEVPTVDADTLYEAAKKVAMATILARHVWMEGQRNEVCKHISGMLYHFKWTVEQAEEMVQVVMDLTGDEDKTRLITVRSTFAKAEKSNKVTGGPTLAKFIGDDRAVKKFNEWFGSPHQSVVEEYNHKYCVVNLNGKFRVATNQVDSLGNQKFVFMGSDDFKAITGNDTISGVKGPIPKALIWLQDAKRLQYQGVCYKPGEDDTGDYLNLWTGWGVEPVEGDCSGWHTLLKDVICSGDDNLYLWMVSWFANLVQHPLKKPMTAPVIIGRQGVGKSLILEYLGKALGPNYTVVKDARHIHGNFNIHLANTLLLHSEEALYGGEKKHRGIIKSLITDHSQMLEPKGIDVYPVQNNIRLVLTSNEDRAAPVEADDRRFTICHTGDTDPQPEIIAKAVKELLGQGPSALLHFLQNFEYDFDFIRINVKSKALLEMKQIGLEPFPEWWLGVLMDGQLLNDDQTWAQKGTAAWPDTLSSTVLYHRYLDDMKRQSERWPLNQTNFSLALNKLINHKCKRKQMWFMDTRGEEDEKFNRPQNARHSAIVDFPPLDQCRAAFIKMVGQEIEWPEVDEESQPAHDKY